MSKEQEVTHMPFLIHLAALPDIAFQHLQHHLQYSNNNATQLQATVAYDSAIPTPCGDWCCCRPLSPTRASKLLARSNVCNLEPRTTTTPMCAHAPAQPAPKPERRTPGQAAPLPLQRPGLSVVRLQGWVGPGLTAKPRPHRMSPT